MTASHFARVIQTYAVEQVVYLIDKRDGEIIPVSPSDYVRLPAWILALCHVRLDSLGARAVSAQICGRSPS